MSFIGELKRRNVVRVAVAYLAITWLVAQIAETVLPVFGFSDGVVRGVMVVLAIGFVPVLVAAWAFELTPGGVKRDRDVSSAAPISARSSKRLDRFIMLALALAVAYFAIDKYQTLTIDAPDKSIAVMPFIDLSPDADQAYFADGISEELLNYLAKLDDLRVISRSSAFALRDSGLSTPEMADKLDVSYVLEGSVRKSGNEFRITAQLIEAGSDSHLWSETFDRKLDDVFLVQEQISLNVAKKMRLQLQESDKARAHLDGQAYQLYLEGLFAWAEQCEESVSQAIDLFERVNQIEPSFAPAYARLALALWWMGGELGPRAEATANRALELDLENSEALSVLGILWQDDARIEQSRDLLERAIASNPNNELAYRWLGTSYSNPDPHRYLEYVRKAYRVNPLDRSILYHFAKALSRLGRFDEAIDAARERVALNPDVTSAYSLLATMHWRNGEFDEALKTSFHTYRMDPNDSFYGHIVYLFIELEETDLAEAWITEIEKRQDRVFPHFLAPMYARRGEHEKAIQVITESMERGRASVLDVAHGVFRNSDDFHYLQQLYETGFSELGFEQPRFNPEMWWPYFVDYAFVLRKTGEADRANEMIDDAINYVDAQLSSGVIGAPGTGFPLEIYRAQLYNMRGDKQAVLESLRRAATRRGLTCVYCLRTLHHYENLRNDPAFEKIVADAATYLVAHHDELADEGWLLSPEEVMQREDNAFNPFAD